MPAGQDRVAPPDMKPVSENNLAARLDQLNERIARACRASGRSPEAITLIGISKTKPAEDVAAAHALGLKNFGENYLQEAIGKINALEGLLGTEITNTLDGFSTEQLKEVGSLLTEESLFSIKNDDVQIKQTRIDKLRNTLKRKETTLNNFDFESIEVSEVKEETPEEYLTKPVQTANLLEFSDEEPYIYDQKQIGFYFTRNLKTTALLLVLSIVIYNSFSIFWDSLIIFLDNLL